VLHGPQIEPPVTIRFAPSRTAIATFDPPSFSFFSCTGFAALISALLRCPKTPRLCPPVETLGSFDRLLEGNLSLLLSSFPSFG